MHWGGWVWTTTIYRAIPASTFHLNHIASAPSVPFLLPISLRVSSRVRVNIFHIWACVGNSCSIPCLTFLQSGSLVSSRLVVTRCRRISGQFRRKNEDERYDGALWLSDRDVAGGTPVDPGSSLLGQNVSDFALLPSLFVLRNAFPFFNRVLFNSRPVFRVTPTNNPNKQPVMNFRAALLLEWHYCCCCYDWY